MRPTGRTRSRRWRHSLRHSLRVRLIVVFVLLALAMSAVFVGGVQRAFSTGWRDAARPVVVDYMDRIVAELGTPPDDASIDAITSFIPVK